MNILAMRNYYILLKYFIILQPIIDIITYFMIVQIGANITLGIIIRMLFMVISMVYIVWGNDSRYKKPTIIYLIIYFSFLAISFIVSYFNKPVFNIMAEVQWLAKISYFIVMFSTLFLLLSSTTLKVSKKRLLKSIYIAITITTVSILIAILSGTSSNTYDWVLLGQKGWFYAGNEIGAIISITFPLVLLYSIKNTKSIKDYLYWIPTLLLGLSGFILGTKVGFLSISFTLVIGFIYLLINGFRKNKLKRLTLSFTAIIMVLIIIFAPFSPGIKNLSIEMPVPEKKPNIENQNSVNKEFEEKEEEKESKEEKGNKDRSNEKNVKQPPKKKSFIDSKIVNKILSSRQIYFSRQYEQYAEANIAQKLFGMGYSGNYKSTPKTIEMDLLDVFFSFGIFGSLFIFAPFILTLYFLLKTLFKSIRFFFRIDTILYCVSFALGIGVSIIAGHVLFAPAVSLYFSIPIVFLLIEVIKQNSEVKLAK